MKMELIEGSETSANHNRTPGKYPKEYIQVLYISGGEQVFTLLVIFLLYYDKMFTKINNFLYILEL